MDESMKWERYGALGGILFVILVIASIVVAGSTPQTSDSAAKILQSIKDNKDGIEVAAFLGGLATLPILWWAGSLWARMRRAEGGQPRLALIAVLGLVFAGASQAGIAVITSTLAIQVKTVSGPEAKFFFLLSQGLNAASVVGIRRCSSRSPRWCSRRGVSHLAGMGRLRQRDRVLGWQLRRGDNQQRIWGARPCRVHHRVDLDRRFERDHVPSQRARSRQRVGADRRARLPGRRSQCGSQLATSASRWSLSCTPTTRSAPSPAFA